MYVIFSTTWIMIINIIEPVQKEILDVIQCVQFANLEGVFGRFQLHVSGDWTCNWMKRLCRYFYFFFDLGPTQVKCQLLNHDIIEWISSVFLEISKGAHLVMVLVVFFPGQKVGAHFCHPVTKSLKDLMWHWLILALMGFLGNIRTWFMTFPKIYWKFIKKYVKS